MIKAKHTIMKKRKVRFRKFMRKRINGTSEKPRMIIVKSNKYIYTQVIDDSVGKVLASASTLEKELKEKLKSQKDKEAAKLLGKTISERLKKAKVGRIVFDRNLYPFAGKVKAFADSVKENGITI